MSAARIQATVVTVRCSAPPLQSLLTYYPPDPNDLVPAAEALTSKPILHQRISFRLSARDPTQAGPLSGLLTHDKLAPWKHLAHSQQCAQ